MSITFAPLADELARWRDEGRILPLWWRDDDAVAPSPQLDRLIALAAQFGAPLHLSVVPARASDALAERVAGADRVFALPHGWRHDNHAPAGAKKAEFGPHRAPAAMIAEIADGWQRIEALFGSRARPIFVPPWNRIAPAVVASLADIGLQQLSTYTPRRENTFLNDPGWVSTHIDPIDWRGGGGLYRGREIERKLAINLRDRRSGRTDADKPYGLLTHHLVQSEEVWAFLPDLLTLLLDSGVARWTDPLG